MRVGGSHVGRGCWGVRGCVLGRAGWGARIEARVFGRACRARGWGAHFGAR